MTIEELFGINNFIEPLDDGVIDDNLDDDLSLFFNNSILVPPPNAFEFQRLSFPLHLLLQPLLNCIVCHDEDEFRKLRLCNDCGQFIHTGCAVTYAVCITSY